ncbi:MAG: carbohydrate binding domain-containing protein, partial [Bacteroidota bacterium]
MKIFTKTLNTPAVLVGCLFLISGFGFRVSDVSHKSDPFRACSDISGVTKNPNSEIVLPPCIGLLNTGFENSLNSWTTSGTVGTTNSAYAGGKSADITGTGASLSQTYSSAVAGRVYTISFYARLNGSVSSNDLAIKFLNSSNTVLSETWSKVSGSTWAAFATSGTAPAGATKVSITFWKNGSAGSLQVDEVCLTETTPAIGECILAQNTGFESGEANWYDDGTNTSVTTAQKYSGTSSLQVVGDGAYNYQQFSISAGSTYQLTAWVKTSGSPTYSEIWLDWKDASNTSIHDILQPVVVTSEWKQVTLRGKAPTNAIYAAIGTYKQGGTGNVLYVDDFCFSLSDPLGGTDFDLVCGCGENRVPNGGYEEVVDTLTFPLTIQGKSCKAMQNDNDWAIRPWIAGIASTHMFYVKDIPNTVNNPEGDYFVWLPASGDCWISNVHFGNNLELEDGEQYTFCFYAASWTNNLDGSGLPTSGTPTQKAGILELEFNINGTVTAVDEYSVPASESFTNLSWTKYSYTFTYSALQTISGFYFT